MNELMNFDFGLEVDGIIVAGLQKIDTPSVEWGEAKVGSPGRLPDKKIPLKKIVGDMNIESVVGLIEDNLIWAKFESVFTGLREVYAGDGFLVALDEGIPVQRFLISDFWIKKVESITYDSREDNAAPVMRNVVLSVRDYIRV